MLDINLGGTIRELRKQRGLTQETLAAALSVTPPGRQQMGIGDFLS